MSEQTGKTGNSMEKLVEIMAKLRSEQGCPWDREQTHQSLRPCVVEETYEVLEAIDSGSPDKLREELGDLLLQVVFHAQLAEEDGDFSMKDVIDEIVAKLIRRHPHVFGDVTVDGVAGVLENWEKIKKIEKKEERHSALDGVPIDLPALQRAEKLQGKAAKVGFDWGNLEGPLAKTKEEFSEFEAVLGTGEPPAKGTAAWDRLEDEFGDILFSLVNVGRFLKIDSEMALRRAINKFIQRFSYIEQTAATSGRTLNQLTLDEMEALWQKAKTESWM